LNADRRRTIARKTFDVTEPLMLLLGLAPKSLESTSNGVPD
jgi:hypothetical protein